MTHYVITRRFDDQAEVYTAEQRHALLALLSEYLQNDEETALQYEITAEDSSPAAFAAYCSSQAENALTFASLQGIPARLADLTITAAAPSYWIEDDCTTARSCIYTDQLTASDDADALRKARDAWHALSAADRRRRDAFTVYRGYLDDNGDPVPDHYEPLADLAAERP